MKNHLLYFLILVLVGVFILGVNSENASAKSNGQFLDISQLATNLQAVETPVSTIVSSAAAIGTPASHVLPPVGRNAGLVIGASVLVLIIIGGVLGSRRRQNH
jgi:hypothetical protein